jgi:hypothetical protein
MDINQSSRNIRRAWILSATAILVSFVDFFFGDIINVPQILMIPFSSAFGLLASPIVLVLTFMVYRKSRVGAILLFTVNVLERAFTFILLHVFSAVFIIIWFCIALLSGFIFFQGIRGTFAYHQLMDKQSSDGL